MTTSFLQKDKYKVDELGKIYFTYEDIEDLPEWPEGPLIEILNGELYVVPSPSIKHQTIIKNLAFMIHEVTRNSKVAKVFISPVDVLISEKSVVIPNLFIILKEKFGIIHDKNIKGVPDFILEVLSSNSQNDLVTKKQIYQETKVQEYWIIDPVDEFLIKNTLKNGIYIEKKISEGKVTLDLLNLEIRLADLFED